MQQNDKFHINNFSAIVTSLNNGTFNKSILKDKFKIIDLRIIINECMNKILRMFKILEGEEGKFEDAIGSNFF